MHKKAKMQNNLLQLATKDKVLFIKPFSNIMHNALQKLQASKQQQKKKEHQFKILSVLLERALEVKKVKVLILAH